MLVVPPEFVVRLVNAVPLPTAPEKVVAPVELMVSVWPPSTEESNVTAPLPVVTVVADPEATRIAYETGRMLNGGGGLVSTTDDYLTFCRALLNGGELGGVRLIGPKTLACAAKQPMALKKLVAQRLMVRANTCVNDPSQIVFLNGWMQRDLSFL